MSHQSSHVIINGVTDKGHNIVVDFAVPENMSNDDARKEAAKWVRWVKKQYDDYEQDEGGR